MIEFIIKIAVVNESMFPISLEHELNKTVVYITLCVNIYFMSTSQL